VQAAIFPYIYETVVSPPDNQLMAEQFCLEYVSVPEIGNRCNRVPTMGSLSH
jgi:hypothetical protein